MGERSAAEKARVTRWRRFSSRWWKRLGEESGIEIYSYHSGEGDSFCFFALMTDESAMQSHGRSPAMQAVMADFGPLVAGPPQMSPARPIVAIGFDL